MDDQVETVLANWIEQALSPIGQLPPGMKPERWVAVNFLRCWRRDLAGLEGTLCDAEAALKAIESELKKRGGWDQSGESLHELIHLSDALSTIRQSLFPEHPGLSENV